MAFFIPVFLTAYALLNFYIFIRGWQALPRRRCLRAGYGVIFCLVALSFPGGRLLASFLPPGVADCFTWVGVIWVAAMLYLFLAVLLLDLLRLLNHFYPFFPAAITTAYGRAKLITGGVALGVVALILIGGAINARHPRIRQLELAVDKKAGDLASLHIVMVSDMHLGAVVGRERLITLVDRINALDPDIVLLVGDEVDGDMEPVIRHDLGSELRRLAPRYGVFAVTGNHEYIGGVEEAAAYLSDQYITMLRDRSVKIADAVYLVGREDRSKNRSGGRRQSLAELTAALDPRLPLLVMDHQPFDLDEARAAGVNLQVSGHTHYGQLWPLCYIIEQIYELPWGYRRKGNTHFYVSNGIGTWGPPIRVGNRPEIVDIYLRFQP